MFLSVAPWTSNRQDCFNRHPNWPLCAKATDQMGWRGQLKGIKTGEWGLTGLTSPCPWAERKSSPSFVWNPWRNKGPIRIGQSTGELLKERLKDCRLFTKDNFSPTFWIPEERVLQGNNLGYKERRQNLTTIKALIPPHIKVRIIDPSLAL